MKNEIHMLGSVNDTICVSFIIRTADGKTVVIDGGDKRETDHFLDRLKAVAGVETPRVDAWFLSHPHSDHVEVFFEVLERHRDEIDLGTVYLNFPSRLSMEACGDGSAAGTMDDFYRCLPLFADRVRVLSGGDAFRIGDAAFTVLYSADFECKNCNNSSLVFRMDLGGRSVLFTGDCEADAGRKILRLWQDSGLLDCEFCQMSHHGQNGVERAFYEAVRPDVCLWCTPSWLWTNCDGEGPFKTLDTRAWMDALGVKTHYVMKDGDQTIAL